MWLLVSTYVVCERLSVMHKQISVHTNSKSLSKFSRKPLSGISDQKAHPPPKMKNFRFEMTKVYSKIPPQMKNFRFEMTKVYSKILPHEYEKLQIWNDQSLLQNILPMKNFRFEMTKVYSGIPPSPQSCSREFPYVETYIYHTDNILVAFILPFRKTW